MNGIDRLLTRILAASDAVWLPLRDFRGTRPSNTSVARREYPERGVPWGSGESTEAGRKEAQRELGEAADASVIAVYRPSRGRAFGVKLTDEGESRARGLCGLPALDAGLESLAEVARLTGEARHWVPETALAGVDYAGPDCKRMLMVVEGLALPALARGWIEANASVKGAVWYSVTRKGKAILKKGHQFPAEVKAPRRKVKDARPYYFECLREEATRLAGPKGELADE